MKVIQGGIQGIYLQQPRGGLGLIGVQAVVSRVGHSKPDVTAPLTLRVLSEGLDPDLSQLPCWLHIGEDNGKLLGDLGVLVLLVMLLEESG